MSLVSPFAPRARICFCLAAWLLTHAVQAAVWFVSPAGSAGGDGTTWSTAKIHPAQAAMSASADDEIWVAAGTYVGQTIRLPQGVRLLGGFAGNEKVRGERSTNVTLTILETTNASPVMEIIRGGTAASAVVSDMTFQASDAMEATGRGLIASGAATTVQNCLFQKFKVPADFDRPGAAMWVSNGVLSVVRCVFADNRVASGGYGAAIGAHKVIPCVIEDSQFIRNSASGAAAVAAKLSRGRITGCFFGRNTISRGGYPPGAIELYRCGMTVERNRFYFNRGSSGAALFVYEGLEGTTNRIAFNLFAGNLAKLSIFDSATISVVGPVKIAIINNTFAGEISTWESGLAVVSSGPVASRFETPLIANNLFLGHHKGDRLEGFTGAHCNVFLDFGQNARGELDLAGRPEGLIGDEIVGGLAAMDFHLRSHAVSRGFGDPSLVDVGAKDLLGNAAVHADGSVDAGAIAFDPAALPAVQPKIIHVRPDGDDTATGDSWATAVRTLQLAIRRPAVDRPTEVWLASGRYEGGVGREENGVLAGIAIRGGFAGTETNANQRMKGLPLSTEVYRGTTDNLVVFDGNGSWNELEGLVLDGAGESEAAASYSAVISRASWPHIHHCRFENHAGRNVGVALNSAGGLIEDCHFFHNVRSGPGSTSTGGVVVLTGSAAYNIFRRNVVGENADFGGRSTICSFGFPIIAEHNLWISNRTGNTSLGTVVVTGGGALTETSCGFFHNTWVHNVDTNATPRVFQPANANFQLPFQFRANLVAHNKGDVWVRPDRVPVRDNLLFDNGPVTTNLLPSDSNLFVDPHLAADGWRLLPDSPARDAVKLPLREGFQTDLDGEGAWLGAAPDIGADELVPEYPLAATVAGAKTEVTTALATLAGVFRDWEDTCPDCFSRNFQATAEGLHLDLAPQQHCPDIVCTGELHPVDYPFDFGSWTPGVYPLVITAGETKLRTMSLWVRPPKEGHLAMSNRQSGPVLTQFAHPGVFLQLEGSTNFVDWISLESASPFIENHPNENWFFRTRVR